MKTLRNYHRLGLLEPAQVDAETGYRRYTSDQIPTAQIIRRFRELDMPLEGIAAVLKAPDVRARNELLADHLARLEIELAQTRLQSHRCAASTRPTPRNSERSRDRSNWLGQGVPLRCRA